MNFLEKIKNGEQKKILENSVIFLMLFIIVIIVINTLFASEKNDTTASVSNVLENVPKSSGNSLEEKLEEILSMIDGSGKVNVMVSYQNGIEQIPMYDEKISTTITEETDSSGGTRKTSQTSNEHSIIFEEKSNTKAAVIKQTVMPEVIGVIVVADGANDVKVKENILKAVEATVDVPSHKIQIFARKGN